MKIILINGYPGSGKDTFVEFCSKFAKVDNLLTSTPAKNALQLLGWTGEKTPEVRDLLADLMEKSYELFDGPTRYIREKVEESQAEIVFIHVREPKNIRKFRREFNHVLTIFVERKENEFKEYTNTSDSGVENFLYDLTIRNNGSLEDLEKTAENFIKLIKEGWVLNGV